MKVNGPCRQCGEVVELLNPASFSELDPMLVYGVCSKCWGIVEAQCPSAFHLARLIGGGIPSLAQEVHHYLKTVSA